MNDYKINTSLNENLCDSIYTPVNKVANGKIIIIINYTKYKRIFK
jgi:hypothetical protein